MSFRKTALFIIAVAVLLLFIPRMLPAQFAHIPIESAEQDRAFSEFNHHIAGAFLLIIGALATISRASAGLSFLRKVWPFFFIIPGLYLAFMSDPDVWPMGAQSWAEAFRSNPEARQHKIYAFLLTALGITEFLRAEGKLGRFLSVWSFPALAVFGAILLFFHKHGGEASSMQGMSRMMPGGMERGGHTMSALMLKIKREHLWFSIVGFGVAFAKFLDDGNFWKKPFVPFLWPALISVLGVLLILYTE